MQLLNYQHLLYFWTVAKEGTITAACQQLHLAQPTISNQLRTLERALGHKLFKRVGRNLIMTETGHAVFRYASEIFSLGHELLASLEGRPTPSLSPLRVGVADILPKVIVHQFLSPALGELRKVRLICYEGKPPALLARLAVHELDVVLSDSPFGAEAKIRAFNHALGESDISIFGRKELAATYKRQFPQSLDGAPVYWPTENTSLRRELDYWALSKGIHPLVIGEFEDTALLKTFGQVGGGLFPAPTVMQGEVQEVYGVELVGRLKEVREHFYAITLERKIRHPAVAAIIERAQHELSKRR